jgi:phosphoribosylglycinamide formyltransferase-1
MSREEYCEKLPYTLDKLNPELIVLAGFMKILTPNFFKKFHEKQIVNIHPSLLPKHKGVDTHKRVLEAGDEEHGITIHYVNEELDSGPIIWQSSYFIEPDDDETSLKHKGHDLEHKWYPFVIDQLVQGRM